MQTGTKEGIEFRNFLEKQLEFKMGPTQNEKDNHVEANISYFEDHIALS